MDENIHDASTLSGSPISPNLDVVQGENAGEVFQVKSKTTMGRELDNDIVIIDPKVSRHHAQIALDGDQWLLSDLGSANGTEHNGAPVTTPIVLQAGDRIRFGETELVFRLPVTAGESTAPTKAIPVAEPAVVPPASAPSPAPTPPPATDQPQRLGQPRLAWIAGGLMLLVCLVAILVFSLAFNRIGGSDSPPTSVSSEATTVPDGAGGDPQNGSEQASTSQAAGAPQELALVYEDDFSDSFGGWDDAFDTYTRKVYGNNRYQIEVNASNLVAWGLANRDISDFELEVEAKLEDGDEKSSHGLLFRFQDRDNFYRYDISGDGYYLLSKFNDGEWTTMSDWTESEFINTGGVPNILKVSAFGPDITVWANGQKLASVTDDSLIHGNFGFFAGTFADPFTWVSFDNLKMWTPPGTEITLIPTATRPSAGVVAEAPTPTATFSPPTATPTPEEGASSGDTLPAAATEEPTASLTPTVTREPTPTPVPLPEYASRDQTLGRGEEIAAGRIVFPIFDTERAIYDVYIADIADGDNQELLQPEASQPVLSEDGTDFAYRSWRPDKRGLFARPIDGDDLDAWGFDLFFESARPQFSPVDRSLMYFSRTGGREPAVYRVVDAVGQVMRREGFPIQGKSPKWAPNGEQFVYSSCLGSICGIILSYLDGGAPLQLTDHPSDTNPEISPDGSQVVFMSERGGNWEIYRVNIDGSDLIALTSDPASDGLPTWSPDGSKVAFVSSRDGEWSIWDMDPDGGNKRRHFVIDGSIDGVVGHDIANGFGWVEENIDWIP